MKSLFDAALRLLGLLLVVAPSCVWASAPVVKLIGDISSYAGYPDYSLDSVTAECKRGWNDPDLLAEGAPSYTVTTYTTYAANGRAMKYGSSWCGKWVNSAWQRVTGKTGVKEIYQCVDGSQPLQSAAFDSQCNDPPPPPPPPTCPASGTSAGTGEVVTGWRTGPLPTSAWASGPVVPGIGARFCMSGCKAAVSGAASQWIEQTASTNGYYKAGANFPMTHDGVECTGSEQKFTDAPAAPAEPPPEPNRCPRGTKQVGIDSAGIPMCSGDAPSTDPAKKTTESTVTNPDGSKTTTKTETTKNADGSETTKTTTTTTNPDGSTTSNEKTTTGNNTAGKQGTNDQDKGDLCKNNPNLTICKNSQISGQCETISCDGDAIQCAIAREIAAQSCKRQKDEDAAKASNDYQTGVHAKNKDATLPSPSNASVVDVQNSLNKNGWLGDGQCFADKSFVIQGQTISIPFSKACDYLIVFRYAIMILAALVSFRMLSSSFLKE